MEAFTTYQAAREYLYSLKNQGSKYGIDRMRLLVEALGHPQKQFPIVHIGGTNGKGSTCAMLECIYREAGYKTGMYTSPHLLDQCERIQINRENLHKRKALQYINQLLPIVRELARDDPDNYPSFFEFMTAIAFVHFAAEQVDIAMVEVGLGGRLDATNVVEPMVSAITSVSLDHCDILGDSIPLIAKEKAGIIKPGVPVVIGRLPEDAETVIIGTATKLDSPVYSIMESTVEEAAEFPEIKFKAQYNRYNARTALTICSLLNDRYPVSRDTEVRGLKNFQWDARWDSRTIADGKTLILDATHNPEGVEELEQSLLQLVDKLGYKPVIVAGTLGEMRAQSLMPVLAQYARELHLLVPQQSRACSYEQLEDAIPLNYPGTIIRSSVKAIFSGDLRCAVGKQGDTIVATGSIYLMGEILEALYPHKAANGALLQD